MKIAFIANQFPVLSATFILNQITGLIDLGHDVRVIAYTDPREPKVHPDIEKYNLLARTRYIPRRPKHKTLCLVKALWLVISNFHKGPVELLRFIRMFIFRRKGLSLTRLYLLLEFVEGDFDIVQCHYGPVGIDGIFLKDAGIKAKICTAFHGFDLSRYPLTHGRNVYDDLFEKGDIFLPISKYWKKELVGMGCSPDRIVVHHMGIDLARFEYSERKLDPSKPIRILTVGRLVEKKGHEYALKAVAKLISDGHNIEYTIAGDGPLREYLESLASPLKIRDNVEFPGPVAHDEVVGLCRRADLFLLPSVTAADGDKEGIPVVLMEALAAGLGVLATDHSGISEIIIDGQTGLLAPERDVDALVEKLRHLFGNPDICRQMARRGREYVEQNYNIQVLNKRLIDIFEQLQGGPVFRQTSTDRRK